MAVKDPGDPLDLTPRWDGQHADHVALPEEYLRLGLCRPVRDSYVHSCGTETRMPRRIAETYASDPKFYQQTFCCGCRGYYPVDEFRWSGTDQVVGS